MKNFNRYVATAVAAAVMMLTATAPAHAVYDENGRLVAVIITEEGTYY